MRAEVARLDEIVTRADWTVPALETERDAANERAEKAERERDEALRTIAYAYESLKAYDTYQSGGLDGCVREVLRQLTADWPQRVDAATERAEKYRAEVERLRAAIEHEHECQGPMAEPCWACSALAAGGETK